MTETPDETPLADLSRITADIKGYLEERAAEIAAPVLEQARQVMDQAGKDIAGCEQRLEDLRREFGRMDKVRDRIAGQCRQRAESAEAALARVRALDSAAILTGGERYIRADYVREAIEGDSDE